MSTGWHDPQLSGYYSLPRHMTNSRYHPPEPSEQIYQLLHNETQVVSNQVTEKPFACDFYQPMGILVAWSMCLVTELFATTLDHINVLVLNC